MGRLESLARGTPTGTQLRTVFVADPAPAAGFQLTPDAGRMWEVLSVSFIYVASDQDADRVIGLSYGFSETLIWSIGLNSSPNTSTSQPFSFIADYYGDFGGGSGSPLANSIPHVLLPPGYTLAVSVTSPDPGDQITGCVAQVLEAGTGVRESERDAAERFAERLASFLDLSREDY